MPLISFHRPFTEKPQFTRAESGTVTLEGGGSQLKRKSYYLFVQREFPMKDINGNSVGNMRDKVWTLHRPFVDAAKCVAAAARVVADVVVYTAEGLANVAAYTTLGVASVGGAVGGAAIKAGSAVVDKGVLVARGASNKFGEFVSWAHTSRKRIDIQVRESRQAQDRRSKVSVKIAEPNMERLPIGSTGVITVRKQTRAAQAEAVKLKNQLEEKFDKLFIESKKLYDNNSDMSAWNNRTLKLNKMKESLSSDFQEKTSHVKNLKDVQDLAKEYMKTLDDIKWE